VSGIIALAFGFAGFFAGLMLWVQFTRWLGLLYVTASKEGGDFLGPPKRRLLWAIPFVALLHPAPWLIGIFGFFAVRAISSDAAGDGNWFLGGVTVALFFMTLLALTTLARLGRLRQSQKNGNDNSRQRAQLASEQTREAAPGSPEQTR
jgi:hypothetical protein